MQQKPAPGRAVNKESQEALAESDEHNMKIINNVLLGYLAAASSLAQAPYQLNPISSPALERERQASRAFADWRQKDEPVLRSILAKKPEEALRLVTSAAASAREYSAAHIRYLEALRSDIKRDLSEVQASDRGGGMAGVATRRDQIQMQMLRLYEDEKRLDTEIKKLGDSFDPSRVAAIRGILETEQQSARELRDNLMLQLKQLDVISREDSRRESTNKAITQEFHQLDGFFAGQIANATELSKALDDYYGSLRIYIDARANRLKPQPGKQLPEKRDSGLTGVWRYRRPASSRNEGQPREVKLALNERDGLIAAELSYLDDRANGGSTSTQLWKFNGKMTANVQLFEFSVGDLQIKVVLDYRAPDKIDVSWTSSGRNSRPIQAGPFTLVKAVLK